MFSVCVPSAKHGSIEFLSPHFQFGYDPEVRLIANLPLDAHDEENDFNIIADLKSVDEAIEWLKKEDPEAIGNEHKLKVALTLAANPD